MGTPAEQLASLNRELRIDHVGWRSHIAWLRQHFHPGQHISIIVPTGGGKTYLVRRGILPGLPALQHARILWVDDKGDDPESEDFGEPITRYPLSWIQRFNRHGSQHREQPEHYRLIVPDWEWTPDGSATQGVAHARRVVGEALNAWYKEANRASPSIEIIDETAAMTGSSPPSLNLGPLVKRGWRKLRYKAGTIIAMTQAPLGVPSEFYHQATHLYVGPILDQEQRRRLREIGGNSKAIERVVEQLRQHEFLFLGDKGRHMHIVMVGRG